MSGLTLGTVYEEDEGSTESLTQNKQRSSMEGFAALTATQRAVLEALEEGDLLLVTHPIVGQAVAPATDDQEDSDEYESEEEYVESDDEATNDGDVSGEEDDEDDEDANSFVSISGPAHIALPATSDVDIEVSRDGDEEMQSDRGAEDQSAEADKGSESEDNVSDNANGANAAVHVHVPPQVYVVASVSKTLAGALTSLVLTPMTYTHTYDPLNTHAFRIFGKATSHIHKPSCATCPAALDFTALTTHSILKRNPSGDAIRIVDATNFPTAPHGCYANCHAGFLHAPDSLNNLFDSYAPPLTAYLRAQNISTAVFLPTLQRIVCPICIGFDLLQEQQILQTSLLQVSWVDFDNVLAFLSRLSPRRKELGLSFVQFDEREWGFYFADMLEDSDEEDAEDGLLAADNDRWQQWDEAMDPNATIATSPAPAEVVAALPRFVFGETTRAKEAAEGEVLKCRICLEDMQQTTKVAELPCGHADCEECVVEWLKAKDSCHVCRRGVVDGVQTKEDDGSGDKAEDEDEEQTGKGDVVDRDGDVEMGDYTADEDEAVGGVENEGGEEEDVSEDMASLIAAAMAAERRLSEEATGQD
jgi:hypothetical protein